MLNAIVSKEMISIGERFAVSFQRTLRIPDDGRAYPLPPGLGRFPVLQVEDYLDRVPPLWREQGGAFIPMYQREALWLGFHGAYWKPNAVKIAVGKIDAISGEPADKVLHSDPQDYLVCPDQPWLDGIHTEQGSVRQFVAMPLGLGYTIESSMTGAETIGGIQITVFEPKPSKFPNELPLKPNTGPVRTALPKLGRVASMGLGAGGMMKQKIYSDPYGIDTWDQGNYGEIFVHIINSTDFFEIVGLEPPPTPIDARTYTEYGLPWFDLFDETKSDIAPTEKLAQVKTVAARDAERELTTQSDPSIEVPKSQIERLRHHNSTRAKDYQPSSPDSVEHLPEDE
jgi:hypothetical protein